MSRSVKIGNKIIDREHTCYVIAEGGINHNGDVETAKRQVMSAVEAGADAIKFQKIDADKFVSTIDHPDHYDFFKRVELSEDDFTDLSILARKMDIDFLCSVFDPDGVDLMEDLGVPAFKVASGELTNHPLLRKIADTGKPIILSTGMASISEIAESIECIYESGNEQLVLLHCVSTYPAPVDVLNLRSIRYLADIFQVPVGFSDHSLDIVLPSVSVALGAKIVEKHFTLDRGQPNPDAELSLEPEELRMMIDNIRRTEKALGTYGKQVTDSEQELKKVARKSIVASTNIDVGEILTKEMVTLKRPAKGIHPKFFDIIEGFEAKDKIKQDEVITWEKLKEKRDPPSSPPLIANEQL